VKLNLLLKLGFDWHARRKIIFSAPAFEERSIVA